jgi:hypothetical protein
MHTPSFRDFTVAGLLAAITLLIVGSAGSLIGVGLPRTAMAGLFLSELWGALVALIGMDMRRSLLYLVGGEIFILSVIFSFSLLLAIC